MEVLEIKEKEKERSVINMLEIGDFRVAFRLYFKANPSAQSFLYGNLFYLHVMNPKRLISI